MNAINYLSRDELYDLYIIQNKTISEIVKQFGCNQHQLFSILKKYNIKKNSSVRIQNSINKKIELKKKDPFYGLSEINKKITQEQLYELYIIQDLSLKEIAGQLNTSLSNIYRRCKYFNIHKTEIHPKRTKKPKYSNKKAFYNTISKEELYDLYINQNLSCTELAKYLNTNTGSLRAALNKYGIKKPRTLLDHNRKKTMLKKYNVEYYSQVPQFKEQIEQTHIKNCKYKSNFQDPIFKNKIKEQNLKLYNVTNPMQRPEIKQKVKNTKLKKYGDENYINIKQIQQTNLKRYGVSSYSKTEEFKEKQAKTCLKRYGETSNFKTKEFKEQSKQTCLKKYGVENAMQLESTKQKVHASKKKNKTIVTSSFEEKIFKLLCERFNDVERQYISEKYPFACDFYIPKKDLYVEYQGHFSHNNHPFDPNNIDDLTIVDKWKAKNRKTYDQAITVWTVRDPLKRQTAKNNNLNWIEFFSMNQFMEWYNEN